MIKRFIQREQAKCNFCMNWFAIYSQMKFGLNICESCIYKAQNTSCFKFPTPEGNLYQVYIAKRHICVNGEEQSQNLQKIDEFMHSQLRELLEKWEKIIGFVKNKEKENKQVEQSEGIWKKIQFILKNDRKKFQNQVSQTIEQIIEDVDQPEPISKPVANTHRTPLRQKKSTNISIKNLESSANKSLIRDSSKKSLGFKSSSRKSIVLHQNNPNSKQMSPSPFALTSSSRVSARSRITLNNETQNTMQSNRQFQAHAQALKNKILYELQRKFGPKSANLLNIKREKIFQVIQNTTNINKCIELVSHRIPDEQFDMECYLASLQWQEVEVVKFVKVGLTDEKFKDIMECISDKAIQTLVLTNNSLTEESINQLARWQIPTLKNIYIGKNNILPLRVRDQLGQLRKKFRIFV